MTNLSYQQHFAQRGSAYDRAMQRYPEARAEEFGQVVAAAQLSPGMTVADVPAGGGYLQRYLPRACRWLGHEPCAAFGHGAAAGSTTGLLPLPWADASIDVAISLAGVHHIADKRPLFAELHRVVRPGGRLVLSDVARGSAVAQFLDAYVGAHNSTGHEGDYLDERAVQQLLAAGWHITDNRTRDFHWVFAHREAMVDFCQQLFDLRSASAAQTRAVIEARLGVTSRADGQLGMHWSLQTCVALRPQTKPG